MTPEVGYYLEKSHRLLAEAEVMLKADLHEAAGRSAYLAGYHVAQAFVLQATGRAVKTHKGLQVELHRLTRNDSRADPELRIFLSQAYTMKAIADYETGPGSIIPAERAEATVARAGRFVAHFEAILRQG